jgi:hypothetical protein
MTAVLQGVLTRLGHWSFLPIRRKVFCPNRTALFKPSLDHGVVTFRRTRIECSFYLQKDLRGGSLRLAYKKPYSTDVPQRQKMGGFDKYAKRSL